ncbi:unnamed protein product [Brassicogethes aeneus]|uniref:Protein sleepless n=1 Tax=Brassicogethes aeneus TaxID=1431903 RepID=A0A9P0BIV3_BRAAE|nr:unnamed protein product [Brassicogethes aeneus]
MSHKLFYALSSVLVVLSFIAFGEAVRCYQCSSNEDPKGFDNCAAYKKFDKRNHIAIECNSEESHMPGTFCVKVVQQSPKGFIWDGRWRQVIRRCASVADTAVTGVCNWGVYENAVYWEECYCSEDECNSANKITSLNILGFTTILILILKVFV